MLGDSIVEQLWRQSTQVPLRPALIERCDDMKKTHYNLPTLEKIFLREKAFKSNGLEN